MDSTLVMYVNEKEVKVHNPDPEMNLLTYLRDFLCLTGTKYGCGEGGCGACTVLLTKFVDGFPKHISVNACLAPLCTMHGVAITTVEGLGSVHTEMHPVQEALATSHGSQCGYCTPGFIMSMYTLLCNNPKPRVQDIENAFQGNLCRCTGYRPILQGFSKFAIDDKPITLEQDEGYLECDKTSDTSTSGSTTNGHKSSANSSNSDLGIIPDDVTKYGINVERLNILKDLTATLDSQYLCYKSNRVTWYRPTSLSDLLDLKAKHPNAKLLIGNTEIGIETRFKNMEYPVIIACTHIRELNEIRDDPRKERVDNDNDAGSNDNDAGSNDDDAGSDDDDAGSNDNDAGSNGNDVKNVDNDTGGTDCDTSSGGLWIGASVTLARIEEVLSGKISSLPDVKTRMFASLMNMMKLFASPQIKNVGSLGGNIMTASPISDIIPVLVSARSKMLIQSKKKGCRQRILDRSFFTGYRQTSVDPDEIMLKICLPYSNRLEYYSSFKQSRRKDDDIAIVNAAMWVKFKNRNSILPNNGLKDGDLNEDGEVVDLVVDDVILAFGGMGTTVVVATKTMKSLINMKWDEELLNVGTKYLTEELFLDLGTPGGMEAYRSSLTVSFFFKFYIDICLQLQRDYPSIYKSVIIPNSHTSASVQLQENDYHKPFFIQIYDDDDEDDDQGGVRMPPKPYYKETFTVETHNKDGGSDDNNNNNHLNVKAFNKTLSFTDKRLEMGHLKIIGKPVPHISGFKHTTGEAIYVDDLPHYKDELFLTLVLSTKAHANILSIDYSGALECEGVVGVVGYEDIHGDNVYGYGGDDHVFWNKTVTCQKQPIMGLLTLTKGQGRRAALKVNIEYEELKPILSIKEAIEAGSYLMPFPSFKNGDPQGCMDICDYTIEGEVSIGGQEHFYMEPFACLASPHEDGGAEVWCTTQYPDFIQDMSSRVTNIPSHKIMIRVARVGGGFGGKVEKPCLIVLPSIIASQKFKRPIRCTLDRDDDMMMTAGRHPYVAKYKVGFTKEGEIEAVILGLYSNCGCTLDCSDAVMKHCIYKVDNMYNLKNIIINGYLCKTNLPGNTAFRAFGGPQVILVTETIIERIAGFLNKPSLQIRELNLYKESDTTMYKQLLDHDTTTNFYKCWNLVKEQSDYYQQLKDIEEFNRSHRWMKKGLCLTPMKYGHNMGAPFTEQGAALVNVYKDGSVLLSHGGTEIGQGLHTKMIQVAAQVLQISTSLIHIHETNSHIVPNANVTGGSSCSDLFGMAVVLACEKLLKRLQPYIDSNPEDGWKVWVHNAYMDRVSLSATGFYRRPYIFHDLEKNEGQMFHYFSLAACCSVVQIDCLTGDHQVLRTDIVMDVGKSLNPAIDVGQIEGAFMQGYGLYTMEDLKYSSDGRMLTTGPGTYKIPTASDTPRVFNVTLLKNSCNTKAVYSSKAIGEPPLMLGVSVVGAIRNAIQSARRDAGLKDADWFDLNAPVTCERIRMACTDQFTRLYAKEIPENYKPWFKEIV